VRLWRKLRKRAKNRWVLPTWSSQKLFQKVGIFDTNFRIVMDYDFFLRAFKSNAHAKSIDMPLTLMRLIGISSQHDWPNLRERFLEERNVHKKNCSKQWMRILYAIYWSFYLTYRKISHSINKYRVLPIFLILFFF
jgi:hypothetical protein